MKSKNGQFESHLEAFGLKNPYASPYVHDSSKDKKSKPIFDSSEINRSPAVDKPKSKWTPSPVDWETL